MRSFTPLAPLAHPRATPTPLVAIWVTWLALSAIFLLGAGPAAAEDYEPPWQTQFTLHLEGAGALWVDEPQSSRFGPGMYLAIRPGVALSEVVALQWSYALLYTPAGDGFSEDGTAHSLSTGLRLRPFAGMQDPRDRLAGLFVDFDVSSVWTDDLHRFGFDVGLGYAFQMSPAMSLGLVVRYGHIVQSDDDPGIDGRDGQFVTVGLDLGFGTVHDDARDRRFYDQPHHQCPAEKVCPVVTTKCADGDADGVCDRDDRCPTLSGPASMYGCPIDPCTGKPLVVLVQFELDSAELPSPRDDDPQSMDPILDAVAKAMAQDPSCRVCIIGNASVEGDAEHNEGLSRRRAAAVQGYLAARGLATSRIPTTGLGARCQLVPADSLVMNRRVEFRRLQEGESCPTDCSK